MEEITWAGPSISNILWKAKDFSCTEIGLFQKPLNRNHCLLGVSNNSKVVMQILNSNLNPSLLFHYNCFLKPLTCGITCVSYIIVNNRLGYTYIHTSNRLGLGREIRESTVYSIFKKKMETITTKS